MTALPGLAQGAVCTYVATVGVKGLSDAAARLFVRLSVASTDIATHSDIGRRSSLWRLWAL